MFHFGQSVLMRLGSNVKFPKSIFLLARSDQDFVMQPDAICLRAIHRKGVIGEIDDDMKGDGSFSYGRRDARACCGNHWVLLATNRERFLS